VRYTRYRVQRVTHESVSDAINARIETQSREAQAFGIQKVEESGSEDRRQGLEERRRSGKVSELETLAD
jgi:hypothetical protein